MRKLPCPAFGRLSISAEQVSHQFGDLLSSVTLPDSWREVIAECYHRPHHVKDIEIQTRRADLAEERHRLLTAYFKRYLSESELDAEMERVQSPLGDLPTLPEGDAENGAQAVIDMGESLTSVAEY